MNEKTRELVGLLAQECDSMQDVQNLLKNLFKGTIEEMQEAEMDTIKRRFKRRWARQK